MNRKCKSILSLAAFLASFLCFAGVSADEKGALQASAPGIDPYLPGNSVLDDFIAKSGNIIDNVANANISGTNVYYLAENNSGQLSTPIAHQDTGSESLNVDTIQAYFSDWYHNLTNLAGNVSTWKGALAGFNYSGISDGWSDQAWKEEIALEWLAIKATYNDSIVMNEANFTAFLNGIEDEFAGVNPFDFGLPGARIGASWATASPEEVFMVINADVQPRNTFWSMQHVYREEMGISDITLVYMADILTYMTGIVEPAKLELDGKATLSIDYDLNLNVTMDANVSDHMVVLMWDHDDSINNFIQSRASGSRFRGDVFTGDEVFYVVHFNTIAIDLEGDVESTVEWQYDGGSQPAAFLSALKSITKHPPISQLLSAASGIPLNLFRTMIFSNISIVDGTRSYRDASFTMSNLKVNAFDIKPSLFQGIVFENVDLWYGEHRMMGLSAYEDMNGNGIQDLSIEGSAPFLYPVSEEARYKFRIKEVEEIQYHAPQLTGNELNFGINFTGIQGSFVPYDISEEVLILNGSVDGALPENVSNIGFNFKFGVNASNNEGKMKVDYDFGQFTNSGITDPALENYSLNMVTMFDAFRLRHSNQVISNTRLSMANSTLIDPDSNQTRHAGRVRFASGASLSSRIFEIDLDSIPYQVAGEDHDANGQLIPVRMADVAYGQATPMGNFTGIRGTQVQSVRLIYSVSFPTWGGEAIIHDPVFSTFISSDGSNELLYAILIAVVAGAAAIVVLGYIRGKSRSSPYRSMNHAVSSGEKGRPRIPRITHLFSFLFQFKHVDPDGISRGESMMESLDPATFKYFSSLYMLFHAEMDANSKIIDIHWNWFDMAPGSNKLENTIRQMLKDHLQSPELQVKQASLMDQSGRCDAYLVHGLAGSSPMYLLDTTARMSHDRFMRFGFLGTEPLPTKLVSKMKDIMPSFLAFNCILDMSKFISIMRSKFPVHLSLPHQLVPTGTRKFLDELHQDTSMIDSELQDIMDDLKRLDGSQASNIMARFRQDMDEREKDA
ncbi:hypothetical protein GF325_02640 [Candidatus Bathyarchaeota archaeon]|nr:hypothetical protein [Candidatus Bathyarchaeota archaeon]